MDDTDKEFWNEYIDIDDLWIYDKLILSKKLGHYCGPAGTLPDIEQEYVIRPCVNFRGMGNGATITKLGPYLEDIVPDGYFWCEKFEGRHFSVDFTYGKQVLAVEGFKHNASRLNRFCRWEKIEDSFSLPSFIQQISIKYERLNLELIGDKIIEVHLRHNPNFKGHDSKVIIPVWKDKFVSSPSGDRLGFIIE